ncbi:MAG TPA: protein kinase, partial [Pyrinomonadaceae bacterium]|nr:protein kinase [Pyrinomonadaceae bacterium]
YLAQDTSELERTVAIKLLPAEVASDPKRMQRFVQEAKTVSALNHPNILTIYEFGQEGATRFIATEYVDGVTLREHMSARRMKLHEVLEIAMQIAAALDAAHEAKVVHRDIKPDNIMVRRRDHIVKVLDFGLAKPTEGSAAAERQAVDTEARTKVLVHTEPGLVMGTVSYMSPEQSQGSAHVDWRTDVWSLGVVLYEMVAGRVPFEGKDIHRQIIAIQEQEPPPLSRFAEGAPERLEEIVAKALAKDPNERYQTAKDLLIDLRNLKRRLEVDAEIERTVAPELRAASTDGSQSTVAATVSGAAAATAQASTAHVSSAEYIVSGIKQHKLAAVAALVVIAVGIVGLTAYLHARNAEVAIESIAVLPFQNRSTEADTEYLSDGLAESLIYRLSQLPNLKVSPTSSVFRYKGKEIDPIKVGQELGVNAVLSGRIVQRGDNITISAELVDVRYNKLLWGEQYDRKMSDLLATQREIAREIVDKLKFKVSGEEKGLAKHYTESNEAYQLYLKGRFYWNKRTEEGMQKSLEYFQQAIEKDPNFALAYSGLADTYDLLGAQDAGGTLAPNDALPKAKIAALKAMALDETLAEPHVSLAHATYLYDRDWAAAEREFNRAIELNPNYPQAHHWYAIYLMWAGRSDQAVTEARRALELDPLSLPINMTLGWVLCIARQEDQGIEQLRKTVEMDPNFMVAHHRLGLGYEQKGMYSEAIAEFQKVYHLSGGKQIAVAALGHAYATSGKREDAQKAIAELRELSKQRYVSAALIAAIYAALGDKDQAFAWLDKADKDHDLVFSRLKVDPRFDSLRSDARFADFVKRVGLPQ